jgi:uncharacterized lipoprotein YddW (UPF0748 family)
MPPHITVALTKSDMLIPLISAENAQTSTGILTPLDALLSRGSWGMLWATMIYRAVNNACPQHALVHWFAHASWGCPRALGELGLVIARLLKLLIFALWLLGTTSIALAGPTAEPAVIDDCQYSEGQVAPGIWEPMAGSKPVSGSQADGQNALRLACPFASTSIERASWDRKISLDLASSRGVQLKIYCRDASPVSYFSLYFQSGDGWYHGTFFPESSTGWNTIVIDKAEMTAEGKPAGWSQIKNLRISAWRGKAVDTEFYLGEIRKVGMLGVDSEIAIIRGEAAKPQPQDETRNAARYTEIVSQYLTSLGLGSIVIGETEVDAQRLSQARLVILPYNPGLSEHATDELTKFVTGGGKLLACYNVPEKLHALLKIEGGKHVKPGQPGAFAAIRPTADGPSGAPSLTKQHSWNINAFRPAPDGGRILAEWLDDHGQPAGYPAVLGSTNGLVLTHVLLTDNREAQRRLLLALIGFLVPDCWRQAAEVELSRVSQLNSYRSFDEATNDISRTGHGDSRVPTLLSEAGERRRSAMDLIAKGQYAEAIDQAALARESLKRAYCGAQHSAPDEFRAFWCHSPYGVDGLSWDEAVRRLAENGFTAILPNMLWGGAAFYPSKILPEASTVASRGDQISQCLAACRKYGLQIHVWKVNWNLGHAAPKEFIEKLRSQGRLQANVYGKEELWLCPSHPANQKLELDSMVEIARNYQVDGLHFDYIRYPNSECCYCDGCKKRFQRDLRKPVASWPKDVLVGGRDHQQWLNWRRRNITTLVKAVSAQTRAVNPKIKLSAAVFSNWTTDRDSIGQDWKLWCEKHYLDFVCPMDYTTSNRRFDNLVSQQVQWAQKTPCYPGIGFSATTAEFGVDRVIEQIRLTRQHATRGFTIFNYGVVESQELLPLLGLGITAKP